MPPITRLPPLTALRVLEAIREKGSISAAARHLNVSHSAVSHQVSILQDWSPTPLFVRRGRRTELTTAGHSLAETTGAAFNAIRHEVDRLPIRSRQVVSIGAIPMLAQTWLTDVLADLVRDMPGVSIHLGLALFDRPHAFRQALRSLSRTGLAFRVRIGCCFGAMLCRFAPRH